MKHSIKLAMALGLSILFFSVPAKAETKSFDLKAQFNEYKKSTESKNIKTFKELFNATKHMVPADKRAEFAATVPANMWNSRVPKVEYKDMSMVISDGNQTAKIEFTTNKNAMIKINGVSIPNSIASGHPGMIIRYVQKESQKKTFMAWLAEQVVPMADAFYPMWGWGGVGNYTYPSGGSGFGQGYAYLPYLFYANYAYPAWSMMNTWQYGSRINSAPGGLGLSDQQGTAR